MKKLLFAFLVVLPVISLASDDEPFIESEISKVQLEQALAVGRASAINEYRLVVKSGFDIEKAKSELEKIEKFIEEIDYVLSVSNATTFVEIEG